MTRSTQLRPSRPWALPALLLVLSLSAAACGSDTGELEITLAGLPAGSAAGVEVTGPEGYAATVDETRTLSELVPGSYLLRTRSVTAGDGRFVPFRPELAAEVEAGAAAALTVSYAADPTDGFLVSPTTLRLWARSGEDAPGRLEVRGTGHEPLACTVAADADWLAVEGPGAVAVAPGEVGAVAVVASCADAGRREGALTVTCDVSPEPVEVPVVVTCADVPTPRIAEVEPAPLMLAANAGRTAAGTLTVGSAGTAPLNWEASTDTAWLTIEAPASGTLQPGERAEVQVVATCRSAGTFDGELLVSSDDPDDPLVHAPVHLQCSEASVPDVHLAASVVSLGETMVGEALEGSLAFSNEGGAVLEYTVTAAAPWLALSGDDVGSLAPGAHAEVGLTATCTEAGVRGALVSVFSNDPDEQAVTAKVQLTCRPPPTPDIGEPSPPQISISGPPGEAFVVSVSFANEGDAPLEFTAEEDTSWFAAAPTSGTLAPSETQEIEVTVACPLQPNRLTSELILASNDPDEPRVAVPIVADCTTTVDLSFAHAYLVQVAQDPQGSVDLVAGWPALARAFVVSNQPNTTGVTVRLRAWLDGAELGTLDLTAPPVVPTSISEDAPENSFHAQLPAEWLQPGLQVRFEVDPDGAFGEVHEDNNLFPASAPWDLVVKQVPPWNVTLVPVINGGTTGDVDAANAEGYLTQTLRYEPVVDWDVEVRSAYVWSGTLSGGDGNAWSNLLGDIRALRVADGSDRHYVGVVHTNYSSGIAGMGYVGHPAAVVWDRQSRSGSMAHEVGHNWNRNHAPCGVSNADASYPYAGGSIGVWGWDRTSDAFISPASFKDFMGYCDPVWSSDYTFQGILAYRSRRTLLPEQAPAQPVIMLRGAVEDGGVRLDPAFHFEARPTPPEPGDWKLVGLDEKGEVLFSAPFAPTAVDHHEAAHFAFSVPLSEDAAARLTELRLEDASGLRTGLVALTAPGEEVPAGLELEPRDEGLRISWEAPWVAALVRDAGTGEVLGMAGRPPVVVPAPAGELEVLLSDGVRTRREVVAP